MKLYKKLGIIFLVLTLGFVVFTILNSTRDTSIKVPMNHPLMKKFIEKSDMHIEILQAGEEDVNDDGIKDLVVIYNRGYQENWMSVVLAGEDYIITNSVRAPIENILIEFQNIDREAEIEFKVSGSKDGNFGYAFYRVIDKNRIRNLFGENMDDCC